LTDHGVAPQLAAIRFPGLQGSVAWLSRLGTVSVAVVVLKYEPRLHRVVDVHLPEEEAGSGLVQHCGHAGSTGSQQRDADVRDGDA
jgi:hypothetical protein